ncbi:unnamed protein product [Somion occarium]|uniref:Autophagy-related protein 9 n=1 Tax=Somion occarium TaxID=3059160 RepID=A0ABP1DEG0_9APHY
MLNPMGRTYQGYMQANQSVLEEEEEEENDEHGDDLESGSHADRSTLFKSTVSKGKRVAWGKDGEASEMSVLRPNIRQEDKIHENESSDDEVPQDFMIEAATPTATRKPSAPRQTPGRRRPLYSTNPKTQPSILPTSTPVSIPPRPSEVETREASPTRPLSDHQPKQMRGLDAYERALWNWVNVYNLDAFLQEAYYYYEGKGIYSIALSRGLNLLTVGFVIGFSTFLLGCIDYSRIKPERATRLSHVVVSRCVSKFSGFTFLFFLLFTAFLAWQIMTYVLSIMRLVDMYRFYTYLLRIPDADIQTISWPEVVRRIGTIREDNPITAISSNQPSSSVTAKLDAHDIANRIMRQENYLIALFNKELLDLRVPLPPFLKRFVVPEEGKGKMLTRALEWNLRFCLMEYLFDPSGRVRKVFLKSKNRAALIGGLRRRFIFMGILNAIFAPFIVLYLLMYSFFRYTEEYHKNPSNISGRRYTPFAQWKFREFNELPHLFARRLNESYPMSRRMVFSSHFFLLYFLRFIAFIAGSFAAVLLLASVVDPDLIVHFEVTPHRTVLFYLSIFASILAVARGMIPEENQVFDPELLMTEVIQYTHYMPDEWKDQLHSKKVHEEFGELFSMKIMIFAEEILSVLLTPFVLWYSLPPCAPAIIDFFREFTVHVDGLGYVCSFAVFDFQRHGNIKFGAPTNVNDERLMSKEGKMEKSFLNFKAAHPEWMPTDPSGSLYLSRMADFSAAHPLGLGRRRLYQQRGTEFNHGVQSTILDRGRDRPEDKASEYDRALKASQMARRRGGGSVLMQSTRLGPSASSIFQSNAGLAQTAVLGDSQGSTFPQQQLPHGQESVIPEEDLMSDGGVGSTLGESYVDGRRPQAGASVGQSQREEDEELEDGGVIGLLAQIYGTGVNLKGRGRGPPRAI